MVAVSGELLGENSGIFWGVKIDPTFGGLPVLFGGPKVPHSTQLTELRRTRKVCSQEDSK